MEFRESYFPDVSFARPTTLWLFALSRRTNVDDDAIKRDDRAKIVARCSWCCTSEHVSCQPRRYLSATGLWFFFIPLPILFISKRDTVPYIFNNASSCTIFHLEKKIRSVFIKNLNLFIFLSPDKIEYE